MKKNFGNPHKLRPVSHMTEKSIPSTGEENILFSFADFNPDTQGDSCEKVQKRGVLANIFNRFGDISMRTESQARKEHFMHVSDNFPNPSGFTCPDKYKGDKSKRWGHLRRIHELCRVAGYLKGNVFHVVWLDLDHKFWPSKR